MMTKWQSLLSSVRNHLPPSQRMLLQRYVYCANAYLYNADADIKTLPRGGAFFCFKKKGGIRNRWRSKKTSPSCRTLALWKTQRTNLHTKPTFCNSPPVFLKRFLKRIHSFIESGVAASQTGKTGSPEYIEISGNKMPTLSGTQDGRCP